MRTSGDEEWIECDFSIDREATKTPRRNDEIEESLQFHNKLCDWTEKVGSFCPSHYRQAILDKHNPVVVPSDGKTERDWVTVDFSYTEQTIQYFVPSSPYPRSMVCC